MIDALVGWLSGLAMCRPPYQSGWWTATTMPEGFFAGTATRLKASSLPAPKFRLALVRDPRR